MKNNKMLILVLILILVIVIGFGIYKIYTSYLFNQDGTISNVHEELLEHIKSIEDEEERKKQVDFSLESNIITQEEANELY